MKKYMPGFVPINFKNSGKVISTIGITCLIVRLISFFTGWFSVSNYFVYLGVVLILLSLYLIFVVPVE